MLLLSDLDIAKKKVALRLDLNVPIKEGVVTDDTRILASLETLNYLIKAEAKIVVLSHLGRPKEGTFDEQLSLRPVASHLSNELGISISLINSMKEFHDTNAQICMLENIRFFEGESKNSDSLAREIGSLDYLLPPARLSITIGISEPGNPQSRTIGGPWSPAKAKEEITSEPCK